MFIKLCLNCSGSEGICCGQLVAVGCWSLCCSIWSLHIYLGNWGILTSLLSQCHFFVCFPSLGQTSYLFLRVLITSRKTWQIHNLEKKKSSFLLFPQKIKCYWKSWGLGTNSESSQAKYWFSCISSQWITVCSDGSDPIPLLCREFYCSGNERHSPSVPAGVWVLGWTRFDHLLLPPRAVS